MAIDRTDRNPQFLLFDLFERPDYMVKKIIYCIAQFLLGRNVKPLIIYCLIVFLSSIFLDSFAARLAA